jgi:hypothetical protein
MKENIERLLATMARAAGEETEEAQILTSVAVVLQADKLPEEMVNFHQVILGNWLNAKETAQTLQK